MDIIQLQYEESLRVVLDPKLGYTSREIAHIFDMDRYDVISMGWTAVYHGVLKLKVITIKDKGVCHWKVIPPKTRKYG